MNSHFITLTNKDDEFDKYLWGTFSQTQRAIPVETFGAMGERERITFQIIPIEMIEIPPWWRVYSKACRPGMLGFTLGPAVVVWLSHAHLLTHWSKWTSWTALLGIFFLHAGAFMLNDVQDHIQGSDRTNRRRGSRLIQMGWVSAFWMRRWAVLNLAIAGILGGLASIVDPFSVFGLAAIAAICVLVLTYRFGARFGLCDLSVLLLFGPLVSVGVSLTSYSLYSVYDVILGTCLGLTTLFSLQIRQVASLFRSRKEAFRTYLGYLNYESARRLLILTGVLCLIANPIVALIFRMPLVFLLVQPLFAWPLAHCVSRIHTARSPLSSEWLKLSQTGVRAQLGLLSWWILVLGLMWLY